MESTTTVPAFSIEVLEPMLKRAAKAVWRLTPESLENLEFQQWSRPRFDMMGYHQASFFRGDPNGVFQMVVFPECYWNEFTQGWMATNGRHVLCRHDQVVVDMLYLEWPSMEWNIGTYDANYDLEGLEQFNDFGIPAERWQGGVVPRCDCGKVLRRYWFEANEDAEHFEPRGSIVPFSGDSYTVEQIFAASDEDAGIYARNKGTPSCDVVGLQGPKTTRLQRGHRS